MVNSSILKGFTILQNGNHHWWRWDNYSEQNNSFSEIVLENLIIKNNIASDDGGESTRMDVYAIVLIL